MAADAKPGVAARAACAIEQLDSWMAEDERPADPAFYGSARAGIRYQPKGVVGNIVPWNFPFDLSAGGLTLAREFPALRWDHLLYTGSPAVGREVALAAARNLVPVTLELGGKCPASSPPTASTRPACAASSSTH